MIRTNYPETLSSWRQVWPFGAHPFSSPTKPAVEPTQDATVYDPLRPFPPSEPRRGPVLVFCDFPSRLAPALVRFDLPLLAQESAGTLLLRTASSFRAIGLGGAWKVGTTTRVVVTLKSDRPVSGLVQADTIDGDGVPVQYRSDLWRLELDQAGQAQLEIYLQSGRAKAPITLRWIAQDGTQAEAQLSFSAEGTQALPAYTTVGGFDRR